MFLIDQKLLSNFSLWESHYGLDFFQELNNSVKIINLLKKSLIVLFSENIFSKEDFERANCLHLYEALINDSLAEETNFSSKMFKKIILTRNLDSSFFFRTILKVSENNEKTFRIILLFLGLIMPVEKEKKLSFSEFHFLIQWNGFLGENTKLNNGFAFFNLLSEENNALSDEIFKYRDNPVTDDIIFNGTYHDIDEAFSKLLYLDVRSYRFVVEILSKQRSFSPKI